jgi:hypothetical protein
MICVIRQVENDPTCKNDENHACTNNSQTRML